jgi:demethylmenaquinone methyltransferase / 2-methoxy-6-polyprenyl-1,4-benzoquinol methylase
MSSKPDTDPPGKTHFGFQSVDERDKARRVRDVFASVASRYDIMNDAMSGGMHRLWKRFAIDILAPRAGERILDVASGSGDLATLMMPRVGKNGSVVMTDINADMLSVGRDRLINAGWMLPTAQCDAEHLPFASDTFDAVTVAFGLRNMTHKDAALSEMLRVLKPRGRLLVLEFSKIAPALEKPYDVYSFQVLPRLGRLLAGDADSYRYLAESIRVHPDQETLKKMMEQAGGRDVQYWNLALGAVAVHRAFK